MQSTAKNRATGEYYEIVPRGRRAPASRPGDAHRDARVIADNILMLAARYRVSQAQVAEHAGISDRSLRARYAQPWEFRFSELEGIGRLFDVSVRQLLAPMRFED